MDILAASLSPSHQNHLIGLLAACGGLRTLRGRNRLVTSLPADIAQRIEEDESPQAHIEDIVSRCADFPGGLTALQQGLAALDGDTFAVIAVKRFIKQSTGHSEQLALLLASLHESDLHKLSYYVFRDRADHARLDTNVRQIEFICAFMNLVLERGNINSDFFTELLGCASIPRTDIAEVARLYLNPREMTQLGLTLPAQAPHWPATPVSTPTRATTPAPTANTEPDTADKTAIAPLTTTSEQPVLGSATLLSDMRFLLDRISQWSELKELCAKPTGNFTCLIHGDASQDLQLFLERIQRHLSQECRQIHDVRTIEFTPDERHLSVTAEWETQMACGAGYGGLPLPKALARVARNADPMLFIIGKPPLSGLNDTERDALIGFLLRSVPNAIRAAEANAGSENQAANPIRIVVAIEHAVHAVHLDDPLTNDVYQALHAAAKAANGALPFHDLIQVRFPPWDDVERYVRHVNRRHLDRNLTIRAHALYEQVKSDPDPHRRSFARLARELQILLSTNEIHTRE